MLFSVVIPTFNRADLLPRTLDSVWRQSFRDFEVIVIDDGSTDETLEYLRSLSGCVRVFTELNKGPGAARNLGIREACGDYIAFLDSDDIWLPWTLDVFAHLIKVHASPVILGARLIEFHDDNELNAIQEEPIQELSFADYYSAFQSGYFVGAGMAVLRRDRLLKSGGFIEERVNAEDHDLILRLGTEPGFVQVRAPITLGWRQHSNSETREIRKTTSGILRLLEQERSGVYPGGDCRSLQRREILTRHARPVMLACLKNGTIREGWQLYNATFDWHKTQRRWKFLVAFPCLALVAWLRHVSKGS